MGERGHGRGEPERRLTRRRLTQLAAGTAAAAAAPGSAVRALAALAAPRTGTYDDGSAAIPPPAAGGDPERVIVIGAGWAGLTAANALRNAGVDVVVLEARRRLGGRAWTRRVGGHPIDLGCSWIHDPIGNPMAKFAAQAGIGTTLAAPEADIATLRIYDETSGGPLLPTQILGPFGNELDFENRLGDYAKRLGPDASIRDAALAYLDDHHLQGVERRRAEFAIRLFAEQEENMYWNRISLPYLADYAAPYDGVGQGNFPTGGYRKLVEAMAGETDVRFGHRVRTIERRRDGVVVEASRRGTGKRVRIRGSHAIVTVPLGVLKHHGVHFAPRLPHAKRAVIRRLGFGYFEKVALAFDEPFWERGGHTHIIRLADPFGFPITLDLQHFSGFPALVALYAGRPAQRLQYASKERKTKLALAAVAEAMGGPIPKPLATYATAWRRDPFARGAYSTVIAGRPTSDFEKLGHPVGRLLFAGEATNPVRNGYADGALTTRHPRGQAPASGLLGLALGRLSAAADGLALIATGDRVSSIGGPPLPLRRGPSPRSSRSSASRRETVWARIFVSSLRREIAAEKLSSRPKIATSPTRKSAFVGDSIPTVSASQLRPPFQTASTTPTIATSIQTSA